MLIIEDPYVIVKCRTVMESSVHLPLIYF